MRLGPETNSALSATSAFTGSGFRRRRSVESVVKSPALFRAKSQSGQERRSQISGHSTLNPQRAATAALTFHCMIRGRFASRVRMAYEAVLIPKFFA